MSGPDSAARPVLGQLDDVVRDFRLGMEARGNLRLAGLVDELLTRVRDPRGGLAAEALAPLLAPMLEAQARGDLLLVADVLEYELRPLLGGEPGVPV